MDRGRPAISGTLINTGIAKTANQAAANSATTRMFRPSTGSDAEPPDVRVDEPDVAGQQQHDPAEVAHRPPEGRHPADVGRRRDLPEHRVIGHGGELERDRSNAEQHQAEPQVLVLVLDGEHGGHHQHGQPGPDTEGQLAAPARVGTLPRHRRQDRHEEAGDAQRPAEPGVGADGAGEVDADRVGQVHGEDEGEMTALNAAEPQSHSRPRRDPAAGDGWARSGKARPRLRSCGKVRPRGGSGTLREHRRPGTVGLVRAGSRHRVAARPTAEHRTAPDLSTAPRTQGVRPGRQSRARPRTAERTFRECAPNVRP